MNGHVFLIGMPGSGKTEVGALVASSLDLPLVDLDEQIGYAVGTSIADLVADQGEGTLRARERTVLLETIQGPPAVVATGGGTILDERNVADMRAAGTTVWLEVPEDVLAERVEYGADRPLLSSVADLTAAFTRRTPLYAAAADARVDGLGSVDEVAEAVVLAVKGG